MRKILTSFSLVAASLAFAQVGINAEESDIAKDAVFHVENKSGEAKGVILPSVSLTAADDQTTITEANGDVTTGLMVWNDGTAGLTPAGYYYWDGAKWVLTGNVDGGSTAPFLGNTKGKIRVLPSDQGLLATTWKEDDFAIVIQNLTEGPELPAPGGDNENRIIAVINIVGTSVTFAANSPTPNSTLRKNSGAIYMSDGNKWYQIASF